jgi:hypothetical protein
MKAQLLLAVNGVFVTLFFGAVLGSSGKIHPADRGLGIATWIFGCLFAVALIIAISCAAVSLWSLHGRAAAEFAKLGVNPDEPVTYRPEVLWYFGHLARLKPGGVDENLRAVDQDAEFSTLSYHLIDLARKVLRKYRWVNTGWAFTSVGLFALIATGASYFIQTHL